MNALEYGHVCSSPEQGHRRKAWFGLVLVQLCLYADRQTAQKGLTRGSVMLAEKGADQPFFSCVN